MTLFFYSCTRGPFLREEREGSIAAASFSLSLCLSRLPCREKHQPLPDASPKMGSKKPKVPTSAGLSNTYVDRFVRSRTNCKMFRGVYPADEIPDSLKTEREFSVILNLSKSHTQGTHFICLIKPLGRQMCMYLDPLALNFTLGRYIPTFIDSLKCEELLTLKRPIQSNDSHYCGYFCIFFCLLFDARTQSKTVAQIVKFLPKDLTKNDSICMTNIQKFICASSCSSSFSVAPVRRKKSR